MGQLIIPKQAELSKNRLLVQYVPDTLTGATNGSYSFNLSPSYNQVSATLDIRFYEQTITGQIIQIYFDKQITISGSFFDAVRQIVDFINFEPQLNGLYFATPDPVNSVVNIQHLSNEQKTYLTLDIKINDSSILVSEINYSPSSPTFYIPDTYRVSLNIYGENNEQATNQAGYKVFNLNNRNNTNRPNNISEFITQISQTFNPSNEYYFDISSVIDAQLQYKPINLVAKHFINRASTFKVQVFEQAIPQASLGQNVITSKPLFIHKGEFTNYGEDEIESTLQLNATTTKQYMNYYWNADIRPSNIDVPSTREIPINQNYEYVSFFLGSNTAINSSNDLRLRAFLDFTTSGGTPITVSQDIDVRKLNITTEQALDKLGIYNFSLDYSNIEAEVDAQELSGSTFVRARYRLITTVNDNPNITTANLTSDLIYTYFNYDCSNNELIELVWYNPMGGIESFAFEKDLNNNTIIDNTLFQKTNYTPYIKAERDSKQLEEVNRTFTAKTRVIQANDYLSLTGLIASEQVFLVRGQSLVPVIVTTSNLEFDENNNDNVMEITIRYNY